MIQVSASDFKTHCLQYIDMASTQHKNLVITKRGKPVARLVPYKEEVREAFGWMAGTGVICGDIMEPLDVEWDALKEE
jgi:prevent-host-death family protein